MANDHDLEELHRQLVALYRPKYNSNQKIVVLHNDHEYFFPGNLTGITTHNFFKLLRHVDIPLNALIILTTHSRYEESIQPFISHDLDRPTVHSLLLSDLTYNLIKPYLTESDNFIKDVKFNALCMLGTVRSHRIKLCQYLNRSKFSTVQHNFNNKSSPLLSPNQPTVKFIDPYTSKLSSLGLIYTIPHRTNQDWASIPTIPEIEFLANLPIPDSVQNLNIPDTGVAFYKDYAVDIVTETNFDYPHVFISEKTLRPILCNTPFLMFGPQGTLKYLKSFGFETFGDVWNETYDSIGDPQERFVACLRVLDDIAGWSNEKARQVSDYLTDRTKNNQKILHNYIDNVFKPVYNKCKVLN